MNIPKVSFIYAYPLDRGRRKFYEENNLGEYPSTEEIKNTIEHWKSLWSTLEEKHRVIDTLIELTRRRPERSLECFVLGAGLNSMSTPFLMPVLNRKGERRSDEMFIQTGIHELLHIFVTSGTDKYWVEVERKYSQEAVECRNHIIVYAMLFEIYKRLLNEIPLDFSRNNLPPGYMRAIELVKQYGYADLINEYNSLT